MMALKTPHSVPVVISQNSRSFTKVVSADKRQSKMPKANQPGNDVGAQPPLRGVREVRTNLAVVSFSIHTYMSYI